MDRIKVMVVNDSGYMTELLSDLVMSSPMLEVSDRARDGVEALRKLTKCKPDVILLDLEMPNMDGLTFLEKIMTTAPLPVIVVSSYSQRGAQVVFDSLEYGAVDFLPIPQDEPNKLHHLKSRLLSKIRLAARINPKPLEHPSSPKRSSVKVHPGTGGIASKAVIIGASTGGPRVLSHILSELPADLPAGLLVVQHMPSSFTSHYADHLNKACKIVVKEARDGDKIKDGSALLAPGDFHMLVKPSFSVRLGHGPKRFGVRPSVNMTMVSASEVYGENTIGVLLSGIGHDGAFGMKMIKRRGGITLAQDENSSVVFGMAKAACDLDAVDKVIPSDKIAQEIIRVMDNA